MFPFPNKSDKIVIVMVGLPARGKSFISQKLWRYLRWLGYTARVFNVGDARRSAFGPAPDHSFFDPSNTEANAARVEAARVTVSRMLQWLTDEGGQIGILDATNTTRERRIWVRNECAQHSIRTIYLESICEDQEIISRNIAASKTHSPDYPNQTEEEVFADFRKRIRHYESVYETITDSEISYIQLINVGQKVVANRIHGHLPARLVYYLMNIYIAQRPIYLTRHGESIFNIEGRIGGDSSLSEAGLDYAGRLSKFMQSKHPGGLVVYTSTLKRAQETARSVGFPFFSWKELDEIDAGVCDGMTYEQIAESMPEEFDARRSDKLRYRYPRGESYQDLIRRVEDIIIELERCREPLLVVGHQAVLRVLYAYLMQKSPDECPHLSIPLHTVIELSPEGVNYVEQRHTL